MNDSEVINSVINEFTSDIADIPNIDRVLHSVQSAFESDHRVQARHGSFSLYHGKEHCNVQIYHKNGVIDLIGANNCGVVSVKYNVLLADPKCHRICIQKIKMMYLRGFILSYINIRKLNESYQLLEPYIRMCLVKLFLDSHKYGHEHDYSLYHKEISDDLLVKLYLLNYPELTEKSPYELHVPTEAIHMVLREVVTLTTQGESNV